MNKYNTIQNPIQMRIAVKCKRGYQSSEVGTETEYFEEGGGRGRLEADGVNFVEEGNLSDEPLPPQDPVDELRRGGALQLLSVQHLLLELGERLSCPHERLGHPPVPAPVAGGDQVRHPAGLEECVQLRLRVQLLDDAHHLGQT